MKACIICRFVDNGFHWLPFGWLGSLGDGGSNESLEEQSKEPYIQSLIDLLNDGEWELVRFNALPSVNDHETDMIINRGSGIKINFHPSCIISLSIEVNDSKSITCHDEDLFYLYAGKVKSMNDYAERLEVERIEREEKAAKEAIIKACNDL